MTRSQPWVVALSVLLTGASAWCSPSSPAVSRARRLMPEDLVYRGAFRLPGPSGGSSWEYSGEAATYYPGGDPDGPADGYPGSIYALGHDWQMYVSEISIPAPVISATKNVRDLRTARTLRPFRDVRAGVGSLDALQEQPRVGMAYLPAQGAQTSGKLYLCWGAHFQEGAEHRVPSHMWCDLDLTHSRGAWRIGRYSFYSVNDYLFDIPEAWANANTPGMRLATGRFRDGGWGGQGPALLACGPWLQGNPPLNNTVLRAVPLLLYSNTATDRPPYHTMAAYRHADEWPGGAWITAASQAAVVFVGTKGTGSCWYGLPDGTVWPEEPPFPPDPEGKRGWWSTGFAGRMLFYDPDDLAAVARGARPPHTPQPYATLDIDRHLYAVTGPQQKTHVRASCFDRARGYLYVFEPFADGDKSIVHVWAVRRSGARPDLMIRHRGEDPYLGNGVYNTTGAGQARAREVRAGAKAVYELRAQNDAPTADALRITGPGSDWRFTVSYFDALAGGNNVTRAVIGGGWTTPKLAPGAMQPLRVEVRARLRAPAGSQKTALIAATSTAEAATQDVARTTTTVAATASTARLSGLIAVPSRGGVQVTFTLSSAAEVDGQVLSLAGRRVRTLCRGKACEAGVNALLWDGRSDDGLSAPSGAYLVELRAGSAAGGARALATVRLGR